MSYTKVKSGWECPKEIKLRKGQQEFVELLKAQGLFQKEYLAILPTGYGKSFVAVLSYQILKDLGVVDRLLLVVPTTVQQDQYVSNIKGDASLLGIEIRDVVMCEKEAYEIDLSRRNESDVFVTTVQKLKDFTYFYELTKKNNWLVIADELHHLADDSTWANGFTNLNYERIIGLTATPLRKDKKKLLVSKDPDVVIGVTDAIEENALRPFRLEVCDYEIEITCGVEDDDVIRVSLSEIEEEIKQRGYKNIQDWELKRQVRYSQKYISGLFRKSLSVYYELEALYPKQNQILVFAWTCEHAKQVVNIINDTVGDENFAKAIGVGVHDEQTNKAIVQEYLDNKIPCLVQVNKAGEGFNNPRSVIGIFLNQISTDTPTLQQQLGRFMRVQKYGSANAVILCGLDHPLAKADLSQLGEKLGEDDVFVNEPPNGKEGGGGKIKIPPLNDFFVEVLKAKKWECIYPFKDTGETNPEFVEALLNIECNPDILNIIHRASAENNPSLLQNYVVSMVHSVATKVEETKKSGRGFTKQERLKDLRTQIKNIIESFIYKCIDFHYGGNNIPSRTKEVWYKNIHYHLLTKTGKKMSERNYEDLKEVHAYIKELAEEINENGYVPSWMYLDIFRGVK